MTGYISCFGLLIIVLFIVFLFIRRRKINDELVKFYQKSQLYSVNDYPVSIREALGKGNWTCSKGSLIIEHKPFEFYWLESYTTSSVMVNGSMQSTISPYLVIVFPSNTVSQEFMLKATHSMKSNSAFKDFFVINTTNPIRVEKLSDGSFLIMWAVLNKTEIYQQKLDWLEANLS